MKNIMLITTCLLCFVSSLQAQETPDIITEKFFEIFAEEPFKAFDYAFSTNPYHKKNALGIEKLKDDFRKLTVSYGEYYGFEEIIQKQIGTNFKLFSFIIRYDLKPIRFTFLMYRAKDIWRVHQMNYDENFAMELVESSKQDRL
jgi:hypothetical protein